MSLAAQIKWDIITMCARDMEKLQMRVLECGYLRVTKSSLWLQQREFPDVWTSEGLTTCVEREYKWSINSTTWNHIQTMWQGPPLDLLRQVHEETQHQDCNEACGCRSPTWRVLRALKAIIDVTESSTNKQHHLSHYSNG
jgi:hypothetical protein